MSTAPSDNLSAYVPPSSSLPPEGSQNARQLYLTMAIWKASIATLLLAAAAVALYFAFAFLITAVVDGETPLIGLIIATSLRLFLAIMSGVPGLLLMGSAIAARRVANDSHSVEASNTSMALLKTSQKAFLMGTSAIAIIALGLLAAFFVALSQSNM